MHRVDTTTASVSLPAPKAAGTGGYFTEGDPGVPVPATVPGQDWFNAVQEEIISVITAAGISLDTAKSNFTQLLAAIDARIASAGDKSLASPGYVRHANGLVVQWGKTVVTGPGTFNFPLTYPTAGFSITATPENTTGQGEACNAKVVSASQYSLFAYDVSTLANMTQTLNWISVGH